MKNLSTISESVNETTGKECYAELTVAATFHRSFVPAALAVVVLAVPTVPTPPPASQPARNPSDVVSVLEDIVVGPERAKGGPMKRRKSGLGLARKLPSAQWCVRPLQPPIHSASTDVASTDVSAFYL
jgi:hypothetical protein